MKNQTHMQQNSLVLLTNLDKNNTGLITIVIIIIIIITMVCVTIYREFNGPVIMLGILHMLFSDVQNLPTQYYLYFTDEEIQTQKA